MMSVAGAGLRQSQLPFGWVCFSNHTNARNIPARNRLSQLPFGWVCFSNGRLFSKLAGEADSRSQLPFGWVCFSNFLLRPRRPLANPPVSIAFRLGLFL